MTTETLDAPRLSPAGTVTVAGETWQVRCEVNPEKFAVDGPELASAPWIIRTDHNRTVGIPVEEEPTNLHDILSRAPLALAEVRAITPPTLRWSRRTTAHGTNSKTHLCTLRYSTGGELHVSALVSDELNDIVTGPLAKHAFTVQGTTGRHLVLPTRDTTVTATAMFDHLARAVLPY